MSEKIPKIGENDEEVAKSEEEASEQPIEESVGKEEKHEKPESPESYNKAEWEKLKEGKLSTSIYLKGKEIGVPQEELDQFASDVIASKLEMEDYLFVYDFRRLTDIERVEPAEPYDEKAWEQLKQESGDREAFVIAKGHETGVPKDELDRFAESAIAREIKKQNYISVYNFRKSMGIGTEEEVRAAGESAYQFFINNNEFGSAMSIAEDVYGKDSEKWFRADEANETEWARIEKEEKRKATRRAALSEEELEAEEEKKAEERIVTLNQDATLADLFEAIDEIEEKIQTENSEDEDYDDPIHFAAEVVGNFDKDVAEEILVDLRGAHEFLDSTKPEEELSEKKKKAIGRKVLDYFEEKGYSRDDVETYLPMIKFKKKEDKE